MQWMLQNHKRGLPMILGDEMGLGKTLQTISLLAHLKESCGYQGPSLIVVPLSVLYSWGNEIQLHAPSLTHFRLHSTENERDAVLKELNDRFLEYDVVVTTYDMLKTASVKNFLRGLYFHYLVLDEGHAIKNSSSQISEAVRRVHCQNKLVLTGTPLQNNLVELYAILNFLCPDIFTESSYFESAFDIGKGMIDSDMLLKANKVLGVFMLRRLKVEVEKLMPKKIETKVSTCDCLLHPAYFLNCESLTQLLYQH
jgi:SWI/SNF-related matrix-associated actin-dependent regulator of chromatin subfamily A member 5